MISDLSFEDKKRLRQLSRPLGFVFWGMLVLTLHPAVTIRLGGGSVTTAPVFVAIGLGLMTAGVTLLSLGGKLPGSAELVTTAVAALNGFLLLLSIASWFTPRLQNLDPRGQFAFAFFQTVGIVALCWCLYDFTTSLGLGRHSRSWAITGALTLFLLPWPQAALIFRPELAEQSIFSTLAPLGSLVATAAFLISTQRLRSLTTNALPRSRRPSTV